MPKKRRRPIDAVIDSTLREAARRRGVIPFIPTLTLTPAEALGLHGPLVSGERRQDRLAEVIDLRREPSAAVSRQRGSLEYGAQLRDAGTVPLEDLDSSSGALERDAPGASGRVASTAQRAPEDARDDLDAGEEPLG